MLLIVRIYVLAICRTIAYNQVIVFKKILIICSPLARNSIFSELFFRFLFISELSLLLVTIGLHFRFRNPKLSILQVVTSFQNPPQNPLELAKRKLY